MADHQMEFHWRTDDDRPFPRCAERTLQFTCPNGLTCAVPVMPRAPDAPQGCRVWEWNGDLVAPTLSPSINCTGGCGWHGFIRNGVMTNG